MPTPSLIRNPEWPVYGWLALTGLYLFGLFLLWQFGYLVAVVENDRTLLSVVIIGFFLLMVIYLGVAARQLCLLGREFNRITNAKTQGESAAGVGWLSEHITLSSLTSTSVQDNREAMYDCLVERIHRGHSLGWFAVDALIRLGLIGTVIGFILMLGAVYRLKEEDVSVLQDLLGSMGVGMQVALYTTLAGISCSLAIALYCKLLDRHADHVISQVVLYLAQSGNHD